MEFNAFAKPKQAYVVEKVKELRSNDAPVREIRRLKKEVERLYDEMNDMKKRVITKYRAE